MASTKSSPLFRLSPPRLLLTGALATQLLACGAGLEDTVSTAADTSLGVSDEALSGPDSVGGVFLKATSYPRPAGSIYVSLGGNDNQAGSEAAPVRTLTRALALAPAGGTIVFRGGVYRDPTVTLNKRVTLQPYPNEKVWFKGSIEVTGFVQEGALWYKPNWTYNFPPTVDSNYVDPKDNPMAAHRDMVFVAEGAFKQVGSKAELAPGRFFVDTTQKRLYLGEAPAGRKVESTVTQYALRLWRNVDGSVIRGLGFAHFADEGVSLGANGVLVENSSFAWNGQVGLGLYGQDGAKDCTVRGNTLSYNGRKGTGGGNTERLVLEKNIFRFNNIEHFARTWDAAAFKLTKSDQVKIRDNVVEDTWGHGIWLDIDMTNAEVVRNTVRRSLGSFGIFFEISRGAIIASNIAEGNGTGIAVANSLNARIWNNTLVGNNKALLVKEDDRTAQEWETTADIPLGHRFLTQGTIARNNVYSDAKLGWLLETSHYLCTDSRPMFAQLNDNVYHRSAASVPQNVVRWAQNATRLSSGACIRPSYDTLGAFKTAASRESNGLALDNVSADALFVAPGTGDYRIESTSTARGRGTALPADVATAVKAGLSSTEADRINTSAGTQPGALHLY